MALPNDSLSSTAVPGDFIDTARIDSEMGGIALNDPSQGLRVQLWRAYVVDDVHVYVDAPYAAASELFDWSAEDTSKITEVSLAFDQNMHPHVAFYTDDDVAHYWWYDTMIPGQTFSTLAAGTISPRMTLDDKRNSQDANSDIILAYIRSTNLYYRQQRDRFTVEYTLTTGLDASARLGTVQMASTNRLQFEYKSGTGNTLADIVNDISGMVNVTEVATEELASTVVRGFVAAGQYTATQALRLLQQAYTFDMPEVDGIIDCVRRGHNSVGTILRTDLLAGQEHTFESAREQGVEYPRKLNISIQIAENDYIASKVTSERRSPDIHVVSEVNLEFPINYPPDEAAQTADILHKQSWADLEGTAKFSLDESWAWLAPSDVVYVEFYAGALKRMRIEKVTMGAAMLQVEARSDRQSVYQSDVEAAPRVDPTVPLPSVPGDTDWEFMDLPALLTSHDTLHYYASAKGATSVWKGCYIQRQEDSDYVNDATIVIAENMGQLLEALPLRSADTTDNITTVLVELSEAVSTVTRDQILKGKNSALVGDEIIQFTTVTEESGDYRLSGLVRGRLDTTPAAHSIGERFVMLLGPSLIPLDPSLLGVSLTMRAPSIGVDASGATTSAETCDGQSQTEWAPHRLEGSRASDDLTVTWVPRWRLGSSANPIVSNYFTKWRIKFTYSGTTVTKETTDTTVTLTSAEQTAAYGAPQSSIDVEVVGVNSFTGEGRSLSGTL